MIISFSNIPLVAAIVISVLILALHVLPLLLYRWQRCMRGAAVLLHVPLIILLFFAGASFDLAVLFLMVSVFIYLALNYLSQRIGKKGKEDADA